MNNGSPNLYRRSFDKSSFQLMSTQKRKKSMPISPKPNFLRRSPKAVKPLQDLTNVMKPLENKESNLNKILNEKNGFSLFKLLKKCDPVEANKENMMPDCKIRKRTRKIKIQMNKENTRCDQKVNKSLLF